MYAGKHRNANKLFRQSLRDPTPNALAQAVWASRRTGLEDLNPVALVNVGANEALTLNHFNKGEWDKVITGAEKWAEEEGFSARPRALASCVAASLLDQPELGEKIAQKGLETNAKHPALVNNKAFSQILKGEVGKAVITLKVLDVTTVDERERICLLATTGLANFRLGNDKIGRQYYEAAMNLATKLEQVPLKTVASMYLAREEAARGQRQAFRDFKKAYEIAQKLQDPSISAIAERLVKDVEEDSVRHRIPFEIKRAAKTLTTQRDLFIK
jgi:hypothetical protein